MFLTFLSEDKAYVAVRNFLNDPKFHIYFNFNQELCTPAFVILLRKRMTSLSSLIDKLNVNLTFFLQSWFSRLFIGVLPYQTVLNIVDLFLFDGFKNKIKWLISYLTLVFSIFPRCGSTI